MVVIDENDVGKTNEQVHMDLIYEALGQRIPLDKVKFGKPQFIDVRKDLRRDPNTFIPMYVDPRYDSRYSGPNSGVMYRRRNITSHCREYDFSGVAPKTLPFKISDILEDINKVMPYPLRSDDFVDTEYKTDDEARNIKLIAHPHSLLWVGEHVFQPSLEYIGGESLLTVTELDGFNYYGYGETYPYP